MKETKFDSPTQVEETKNQIELVKIPTEYGLGFQTPEGTFELHQYLVWLGNIILDLKVKMVGR